MTDWLLNLPESRCAEGHWDNDPTTVLSRVILPLFFLMCVGTTVALGRRRRNGGRREDCFSFGLPRRSDISLENVSGSVRSITDMLRRSSKERMWHLDFARIVCVSCVVVEHSGSTSYSDHNVEFALQWVLPFLFITSGVCFSLSSAPLWFYVVRLSVVLAAGVGANLVADMVKGRDWAGDFGNTVFQMFYVVFLIVLAIVTAPLRRGLKWRRENPTGEPNWKLGGMALLHSGLCFVGFCLFVSGQPLIVVPERSGWARRLQPILDSSGVILASTGGVLSLCSLACVVRTGQWFGWVLLAAIYLPRVLMPFPSVGFTHNVDLYFLGMVVEQFRLAGHKAIAAWIRSYWPLMLAGLMLMGMPNVSGRCDVNPPDWWWERFRFYLIEGVLVVSFVTGAFNSSDPLKATPWLNDWAVYAYCTHVAWYRLLPVPWGVILTYGSAPLFYLRHRRQRRLATDTAAGPGESPSPAAASPGGPCRPPLHEAPDLEIRSESGALHSEEAESETGRSCLCADPARAATSPPCSGRPAPCGCQWEPQIPAHGGA